MTSMRPFPGFDDVGRTIPVPEQFFTDLMPIIDDRAELLVTLYALWLNHVGGGERPFFRRRDLAADERFFHALADAERTADEALDDGLILAVTRGTLLHLRGRATAESPEEDWYCLNTPANRERVAALREGVRAHVGAWAASLGETAPTLRPVRPNIFTLYEQTIGTLQPLIVDELRQAEREYPAAWIEEAFTIAARRNVRNWKYVRAILERWATEGREDEETRRRTEESPERYISGPYGHLIQH